ncbi:MAG: TRAP transporter large permease [Planctomycetes bacterium]|nr:TRAP transporter large permease [Planctomycetota bacterium]
MEFLPIILMFILFALNIPVAYCLILSGLSYFLFLVDGMPMDMLVQGMIAQTSSFTMLAIPLFIAAGVVMTYGGISQSLLDFADILVGHKIGGLGHVNVLLSTFMGGCSGSATADCAFESKILVPEMIKRGYSKGYSAAITAASSIITPIIPPGICLIIYATAANVSIGDMFMAGYTPGILLCIALMLANSFIAKARKFPPSRKTRASFGEILAQGKKSVWALALPILIITSLRVGWITPTECGAMTLVYSLLVGFFVYRKLQFIHLPRVLVESVLNTTTVMLILAAANMFARYLTWEQLPQRLSAFIMGMTDSPIVFLLMVNILMIIMGMFIDTAAALIILPPLLVPIARRLGVDPIHLGIVMCMQDTFGCITPPFGVLMFTSTSITKTRVADYIREGWPLIVTAFIVILLVTFLPGISLWPLRLFG